MKYKLLLFAVSIIIVFAGCDGSEITVQDQMDFADTFMLTFETERHSGLEDRGIRPILLSETAKTTVSKATVPAPDPADNSPLSFTGTHDPLVDYPLLGTTTTYTVEDVSAAVAANVFKITSTTVFPSDHVVDTYVEIYYIKDITAWDDPAPDGEWDWDDPVVDAAGDADPEYRESMTVNYRDGSIRHEYIVKYVYKDDPEDGFAPFDIESSLSYPDFSYPASDPDANFSSVVVYTHERNEHHDYWFWEGNEEQKILGVRYYTEHFNADESELVGTTVSYERAVSTYTTEGGEFADSMDAVFVGSELDTLAESVFRQEVIFDTTGTVPQAEIQNSYMRSHVVNAEDYADFVLEKINDDEVVLMDWENAPYYVPSGTGADEISAEDYTQNEFLVQTTAENPDGEDIELIAPDDPGDLASLYLSITSGFASTSTVDAGSDIEGGLEGDGLIAEFEGNEGYVITSTDDISMSGAAGTVTAWVYVNNHMDTAGIVHKGVETDFSDESYSLQFMGKKGNVAFAIVRQDPFYKYSYAKSNLRLNTEKWYFLAGTYDSSKVKLYIFGDGVSSGGNDYYLKSANNNIGDPESPGGPLVLGSQFTEEQRKSGYYGFDGLINGVTVDNETAWTAAQLENYYDTNKGKVSAWGP